VNTTLITLNVQSNSLGPEGGKAIAKTLEVMIMICCFRRYVSSYPFFAFLGKSMWFCRVFCKKQNS
jgi:hypothetical protein